jgi:non-ribosomal peptide synthetase component F
LFVNDLSMVKTETTICEAFAKAAQAHRTNVAVDHVDGTLDYGALDHLSERLARALRARGIGAGAVVAVGAAPGPYAPDRLRAMLDAAGVRLLLGPWPDGAAPDGIACADPEALSKEPPAKAKSRDGPG